MEKRNWKRSVTLKQRMVLCLAAFFAAFALQLALNGYQARAVQHCSGCAFLEEKPERILKKWQRKILNWKKHMTYWIN